MVVAQNLSKKAPNTFPVDVPYKLSPATCEYCFSKNLAKSSDSIPDRSWHILFDLYGRLELSRNYSIKLSCVCTIYTYSPNISLIFLEFVQFFVVHLNK